MRTLRIGVFLALGCSGTFRESLGQEFWTLLEPPSTMAVTTRVLADHPDRPLCTDNQAARGFLRGINPQRFGWAASDCKVRPNKCPLKARGEGAVWLDGVGTKFLRVWWFTQARTFWNCNQGPEYHAEAVSDLLAQVNLGVGGVPAGTPLVVNATWRAMSFAWPRPEVVTDDDAQVTNSRLQLTDNNGNEYLGIPLGFYNLVSVPGLISGPPPALATFPLNAGQTLRLDVGADTFSEIRGPGRPPAGPPMHFTQDLAQAVFFGCITISLDAPQPVPFIPYKSFGFPAGVFPGDGLAGTFSLDIGSDQELSDPAMDGSEAFDPGDSYPWLGPALLAGGENGVFDDANLFGGDPWPVPQLVPLTAAPVCGGLPLPEDAAYFDLDGEDHIDFSLVDVLPPISDGPPVSPISRVIDGTVPACLPPVDYLVVSYEDDRGLHYASSVPCEAPVTSSSPTGATQGTTGPRDEISGVLLTPSGLGAPFAVSAEYGLASEEAVHVSMTPNPDAGEADDDDVDSLDIQEDGSGCDTWLFTVDHEAPGLDSGGVPLSSGSVYEASNGSGFVRVIDPVVHLGIPAGTDLDAMELCWMREGADEVLALIYSVDDDDLASNVDESGGLDPNMIYASYLTGSSFELLDNSLRDDVDALTAWWFPLGTACLPDFPIPESRSRRAVLMSSP